MTHLLAFVLAGTAFANDLDLDEPPSPVATHNDWVESFPVTERAWPLYLEALRSCPPLTAEDHLEAIRTIAERSPTDNDWNESVQFVKQYDRTLDMLRDAASRSILGTRWSTEPDPELLKLLGEPPRQPSGEPLMLEIVLSELAHVRDFTALLALDARVAAEEGDAKRMNENLVSIIRTAQQLLRDRDGPLIHQLVAHSVIRRAIETSLCLIQGHPQAFSDADLVGLAEELSELDLRLSARFEWRSLAEVLRFAYDDDGTVTREGLHLLLRLVDSDGDPPPAVDTRDFEWLYAIMAPPMVDRTEAQEAADRLQRLYEADLRRPLWQWREPPEYSQASHELFEGGDGIRYGFVSIVLPAIRKPYTAQEGTFQRRDAALVVFALHRYRLAENRWPENLEVLSPAYLAEVPPDRYSGKPLRYRLDETRPVVYSVGVDRDDDGGTPPAAGSDAKSVWIFRPPDDSDLPDGDWILFPPQPE